MCTHFIILILVPCFGVKMVHFRHLNKLLLLENTFADVTRDYIYVNLYYINGQGSKGSLACHTYYDPGHSFIMVILENPWHSHLLPNVWQWSCHYLFKKYKYKQWIVLFWKMLSCNCKCVCKQIFVSRINQFVCIHGRGYAITSIHCCNTNVHYHGIAMLGTKLTKLITLYSFKHQQ